MHIPFVAEYAIWGGIGGFIAILAKCGWFELPYLKDRRLYFGGVQGVLFGIVAGLIGDSNALNAMMWGAGGTVIIQGLVNAAQTQANACFKKGDKS